VARMNTPRNTIRLCPAAHGPGAGALGLSWRWLTPSACPLLDTVEQQPSNRRNAMAHRGRSSSTMRV
jgi:hypothetical protein